MNKKIFTSGPQFSSDSDDAEKRWQAKRAAKKASIAAARAGNNKRAKGVLEKQKEKKK